MYVVTSNCQWSGNNMHNVELQCVSWCGNGPAIFFIKWLDHEWPFETLLYRVPTQTGKPGKMGRHFPVKKKSGNFELTWKVRENHTKYWKTPGIWDKYYLIFLVIFKWTILFAKMDQVFSLKNQNINKKTGKKMAKNTGKVREFCQSGKVGTLTYSI